MRYFELNIVEGGCFAYLGDDARSRGVRQKLAARGARPDAQRSVFSAEYGGEPIELQLGTEGVQISVDDCQILYFGFGVFIFGSEAKKLLLQFGVEQENFLSCRFAGKSNLSGYSLFMPPSLDGVVNMNQSEFGVVYDVDPPLPAEPIKLCLLRSVNSLPHVFYPRVPRYAHTFGMLIVSEEFRICWEELKLGGAAFIENTFIE